MDGRLRNMTTVYILDRDAVLLLYRVQHYLTTGRHTNCLYCGSALEDGVHFETLNEF